MKYQPQSISLSSVGYLGRPELSLDAVTKTPKGDRPTWQQVVKEPEVSPEVTIGGVQTQISTLVGVKNGLLRLNNIEPATLPGHPLTIWASQQALFPPFKNNVTELK